jgi:hypothetical protein
LSLFPFPAQRREGWPSYLWMIVFVFVVVFASFMVARVADIMADYALIYLNETSKVVGETVPTRVITVGDKTVVAPDYPSGMSGVMRIMMLYIMLVDRIASNNIAVLALVAIGIIIYWLGGRRE